jgi:hypothetical protein
LYINSGQVEYLKTNRWTCVYFIYIFLPRQAQNQFYLFQSGAINQNQFRNGKYSKSARNDYIPWLRTGCCSSRWGETTRKGAMVPEKAWTWLDLLAAKALPLSYVTVRLDANWPLFSDLLASITSYFFVNNCGQLAFTEIIITTLLL